MSLPRKAAHLWHSRGKSCDLSGMTLLEVSVSGHYHARQHTCMPVKMFFTVMEGRQPSSCRISGFQSKISFTYKAHISPEAWTQA